VLIVNDTQVLSRNEIHEAAPDTGVACVTISSATLAVTKPDGTVLSPAPAVTFAPSGAAASHAFKAPLTPGQGGAYRLVWSYTRGDGQVFNRVENRFASWTDIGALIRRRLRETPATMPDSDFEAEVAILVRTLVDRFLLLQQAGGYNGLAGLDQDRFDQGVALLTAAKLRMTRRKATPVGDLAEVKLTQGSEYRFTTPSMPGPRLESEWVAEALLSLGRVTLIQQIYAASAASFQPFAVSGPTRNSRQAGNTETLLSGVIRLITDDWALTPDNQDQAGDFGDA
jgi:hypothetical protein